MTDQVERMQIALKAIELCLHQVPRNRFGKLEPDATHYNIMHEAAVKLDAFKMSGPTDIVEGVRWIARAALQDDHDGRAKPLGFDDAEHGMKP